MPTALVRAGVLAVIAALAGAVVVLVAHPAFARDDVHLVSKLVPASANGPYTGSKRSDHVTHEVYHQARKVSSDGRYVVFVSEAPDLVANQAGTQEFAPQVFVRDRVSNTTTLVSHIPGSNATASNGRCEAPGISADGLWVSYSCESTNLVAGQQDPSIPPTPPSTTPLPDMDLFLWSRATNTTALVSKAVGTSATTGLGDSRFASISANGQYIVYRSDANELVSGFAAGSGPDIFLYDRVAGTNRLVSHAVGSPTTAANGRSEAPSISDDGNVVAFEHRGTNLVASQNDTGSDDDVFVWNRTTDTTTLVSRQSGTTATGANGNSQIPRLAADGTKVVYETTATNVVAGVADSNGATDLYAYTLAGGTSKLVTRSASSPTTTANGASEWAQISGNGQWIAFPSMATNLVSGQTDTNNKNDVFAFNTANDAMRLLSRTSASPTTTTNQGTYSFAELTSLSSTGQYIVFSASGSNIINGVTDANGGSHTSIGDDVFLHDSTSGATTLVSRRATSATQTASGASHYPVITPDGGLIVYRSTAHNIVSVNDTNADHDVYAFTRSAGTNSLISVAGGSIVNIAGGTEGPTSASDDGRYVAFTSKAPALISNQIDMNGALDVFLYDTATRTNTLVSHRPGLPTWASDGEAYAPVVSGDGNWVAFTSSSTNLINGFSSAAPEVRNIYLFSRATGEVTLVSHAVGSNTTSGNNLADWASIADDGSRVAYGASGTNMVSNQGEAASDIDYDAFVWTRSTNTNVLASHEPDGTAPGTDPFQLSRSEGMRISGNGNVVLFASGATTFGHTDDTTGGFDFFTYTVNTGAVKLVSHDGSGQTVRPGQRSPYNTDISDNGERISWHNFGSGQGGIYLYDSTKAAASQLTRIATYESTTGENEISGDGSVVAWRAGGNVSVYNVATATATLASHAANNTSQGGNDEVGQFNLSTNGKYVSFTSEATNYFDPPITDPANTFDTFMYEVATNKVVFPISRHHSSDTITAGLAEQKPTMSNGGHVVTFISRANGLVDGDNNLARDAYTSCFPELTVDPSGSRFQVFAGDANTTTHTITVVNSGPCYASQIVVDMFRSVPAGVTAGPYVPNAGTLSGTVWTIPALEPGQSAAISATYTVGPTAPHGTNITTSGNVSSVRQLRLSAFNDGDAYTSRIHNLPIDLALTGQTSATPVAGGQPVTLTGIIKNKTSGVDATNVKVSVVASAASGVTVSAPTVSAGTVTNGVWTVGTLTPQQSRTVSVTFTMPANTPAGSNLTLQLAVTAADQRRHVTTDDTLTHTAAVTHVAALQVGTIVTEQSVVAGGGVNISVRTDVKNGGPSSLSGVAVNITTTVPEGVQATRKDIPPGTTTINETWNLAQVVANSGPGQYRRTLTFTVPASASAGQISTSATIVPGTSWTDPDTSDNAAQATAQVVRQVALTLTKQASTNGITAGLGVPVEVVTTIQNAGPSHASGIVVDLSDSFPAGVPAPTVEESAGSAVDGDQWTISDLPPATPTTVTHTYEIPASAEQGPMSTAAVVSAYAEAPNPVPVISASTSGEVSRLSDVEVTATKSAETIHAGGSVQYVVTISNTGPSDIAGLTASVSSGGPAGSTVAFTPEVPTSLSSGVWSVGTIATGASRSLMVDIATAPNAEGLAALSVEVTGSTTPRTNTPGDFYQLHTEVLIDVTMPTNPAVSSPTHDVGAWGGWSRDRTVTLEWLAPGSPTAADDDLAGVDGYSVVWDTSATTVPPGEKTHEEDVVASTSPSLEDGTSHWFHVRTVDHAGNWSDPSHVGPFLIDGTDPPAPVLGPLPAISRDRGLALSWTPSNDATSGVVQYTPLRRRGGWTKLSMGPYQADPGTTATSTQITGAYGTTYCFKIRAVDLAGNISDGGQRCTAIPLNDAALVRKGTWQTVSATGIFGDSSLSMSKESGDDLRRADVTNAKRIGVLVTKCDGCGNIRVLFDGVPLERVGSTATITSTGLPQGAAPQKSALIQFKPFPTPQSGVVRVLVTSDGKPVKVEGLAASKL